MANSKQPFIDQPIFTLEGSNHLTFRDLIKSGTLVFGSLGAGKSSSSGRALAQSFVNASIGGLVTTVKSDETQRWREHAKQAGRQKDLIAQVTKRGKRGLPKKSARRKNARPL